MVFFDHGDPQTIPEPGAITDWCAPLLVRTDVEGVTLNNPDTPANEAGQVYRTNPAVSGTYPFGTFAVSLPDADNDGYENQLDTCPLAPNAGNPKLLNSGDQDFDGLDAACDPNDDPGTGGTNSDEDGDGYLNRQDNCPLVQNGPLEANQIDTDRDGIGDHCDVNPYNADGHRHMVCLIDHVEVGAGGGTPPQLPLPCDADNDGVPDNYDNCPTVANTAGQADDVDGDLAGDACDAPGTGNVDCSQAVNSVDALKTLRHSARVVRGAERAVPGHRDDAAVGVGDGRRELLGRRDAGERGGRAVDPASERRATGEHSGGLPGDQAALARRRGSERRPGGGTRRAIPE